MTRDHDAPPSDVPESGPTTIEALDGTAAEPPRGELPPDFDEAMFAAELESEFHKIKAEIDRINLNEKVGGPTKRMLVQRYRDHRKQGRSADPNRPPWRVRLDALMEDALDRVVEDGLKEHPDGTISLSLNSQIVGTHGVPIITAMLDGLRASVINQTERGGFIGAFGPRILQFIDNFRTSFSGEPSPDAPTPADPPPSPEPQSAPSAAPFSFDQLLKGFVGAIQHAQRQTPPPKTASAKGARGESAGPKHPRKGGPQTTTVRVGTPPDMRPEPNVTETTPKQAANGPSINIDFAGLLGAVLQQVKMPQPPFPKAAAPTPSAPAEAPPSTETPAATSSEPETPQ